jgi:hypothetical protein
VNNSEGRDHDDDIILLADDPPEQILQGKDESNVDQVQDCSQAAIDQRTIDQQINVVEPIMLFSSLSS